MVYVRERLGSRPDQLRGVDLEGGQDADDDAGQHGSQQDVAAGILDLLGEGRDAVETDVGEDGDGGAAQDRAGHEGCGVVKRAREESEAVVRVSEDVAGGADEEDGDDHAHAGGQGRVDARRGADALEVEPREEQSEDDRPGPVGDCGDEDVRLLADPDDADHAG